MKVRLALEAVVKAEGLKATDKDLEAEYKKLAEAYQMEVDQIKPYIPVEDLKMDIAVGKALDLIKKNAEITEKKVEAEKKPAAKKSTAKKSTASTAKKSTSTKSSAKSTTTKTAAKKTTTKKAAEDK